MAIPLWEMTTLIWRASGSGRLGTGGISFKAGRIILGVFLCCAFSNDEKLRLRLRSALYVVDLVRFRQVE